MKVRAVGSGAPRQAAAPGTAAPRERRSNGFSSRALALAHAPAPRRALPRRQQESLACSFIPHSFAVFVRVRYADWSDDGTATRLFAVRGMLRSGAASTVDFSLEHGYSALVRLGDLRPASDVSLFQRASASVDWAENRGAALTLPDAMECVQGVGAPSVAPPSGSSFPAGVAEMVFSTAIARTSVFFDSRTAGDDEDAESFFARLPTGTWDDDTETATGGGTSEAFLFPEPSIRASFVESLRETGRITVARGANVTVGYRGRLNGYASSPTVHAWYLVGAPHILRYEDAAEATSDDKGELEIRCAGARNENCDGA